MAKIVSASLIATPAPEGKRMIAETMYAKGYAFVSAAALLRHTGGYEYAVLHLLCQGIEVAIKGLLLLRNYDKYKLMLKSLGHNLVNIVNVAILEFSLHKLRPPLRKELDSLSILYSKHFLRYGTTYDILVSAATIQNHHVCRRIASVFRLVRIKKYARPPII